jgi:PAS domain S-box-containing protein
MQEGSADKPAIPVADDDPVKLRLLTELKRSEDQYHGLVENAIDAVISIRRDGSITGFNKKAEQIFGYTRDEILGKSVILLSPPRLREMQLRMFEEFRSTGSSPFIGKTMEGTGFRKDGVEFPFEGSIFLVAANGECQFTVLVRDISDRRKMEELLLQTEKLASLGEFAGGVAHNFNNILAVILGRTQLLRRCIAAPAGKEEKRKFVDELIKSLDIIEKASFDGADTVRRIQDFAAKKPIGTQDAAGIDLNEIIEQTLEFTRVKWHDDAGMKGITISIEKALSPLPAVRGNPSELREVFVNLLNNAIDALPGGGIIRIRTGVAAGNAVVTVEDTGVGMHKDIRDKIFDPFFTTKGVQAAGLGMSVCYGIIRRHNGTITVDSVENRGTICCLTFSACAGAMKEDQKETALPLKPRKACILVVEDEDEVRELLKDILAEGGHEVAFAPDGQKGLALFQAKTFDLVFTDLGMPGMSGWEVAEQIKRLSGETPVALITGWDVKQKKQELKSKGVDVVLKKPFRVEEILSLVQDLMAGRDNHGILLSLSPRPSGQPATRRLLQ